MTGHYEEEITSKFFTCQWSVNKVKENLVYFIDKNKQIHVLLKVKISRDPDFFTLKGKCMQALRQYGLFINEHKEGLKDLDSVGLGWYMGLHPDTEDLYQKEHDLNDAIYNTLTKDNTKWRNWIHSQKDERLKTWNGEILYVSIVITKPFYSPKKN